MNPKLWKSRLRRFLRQPKFFHPDPFALLHHLDFPGRHLKTGFPARKLKFLEKSHPRVLYYIHWLGGVGGLERSSQAFIRDFQRKGCEVDVVYEIGLSPGPYSIEPERGIRIFSLDEFKKTEGDREYDLFYSQPTREFDDRYWNDRLCAFAGIKIMNWQMYAPKWFKRHIFEFDLIHCESSVPGPGVGYSFNCPPSALAAPGHGEVSLLPPPFPDYYLTVFNPYNSAKGSAFLRETLDWLDRPLVWCYDLRSFTAQTEKLQAIREEISSCSHPMLKTMEAPTQGYLHQLYRNCAGYLCFSEYESYGWSLSDAIFHQKPIAGNRVGILREVKNFRTWHGLAAPVFNRISSPAYQSNLIESLRGHLQGSLVGTSYRFEAERVRP